MEETEASEWVEEGKTEKSLCVCPMWLMNTEVHLGKKSIAIGPVLMLFLEEEMTIMFLRVWELVAKIILQRRKMCAMYRKDAFSLAHSTNRVFAVPMKKYVE
jgi:hypothetical protein